MEFVGVLIRDWVWEIWCGIGEDFPGSSDYVEFSHFYGVYIAFRSEFCFTCKFFEV